MLFKGLSWLSPCGAEGPQKLKRNGEGLDKMLSWDSFSKWAFPSPHPPKKSRMVLKMKRFKSLPFLEILGKIFTIQNNCEIRL